ncbi:class I SAM-dependent methyltransferase [Amycolatopsis sp. FDAARGOS 1241]|uniref:class I SAM-dependent methyltransferase n=1 Tax=Amycolatopsis sp. FDAARGOS 1241 TaxID=2778070 RepID=UPI0019520D3E|nr:class I SAM-dependent methyltransferase [Amycolatopsis sp. FDAARGOS 1241]QRP48647.1 class I SAM-dependent methyltransferase [Amycolatopsis sp. FDAARGOS 1241]
MSEPDDYALGRSAAETERLRLQAEIYGSHTAFLLTRAGIAPRMRVLDVGCGAGDVTMQLARLVGPDGEVIGVDVDPAVLAVAQARVADAGLANVSFIEARLPAVPLDEQVDALVGRLILTHLKEPAPTVRVLAKLVRSGGIVTFQDFVSTRTRTVPPCPIATRTIDLIAAAAGAVTMNINFGERIPSILSDAGLAVVGAAAATAAGPADSLTPRYIAELARSMLPVITAHGLATEDEVDVGTLAKRIAEEMTEAGAMFWLPDLAAAWARVP